MKQSVWVNNDQTISGKSKYKTYNWPSMLSHLTKMFIGLMLYDMIFFV